MASAIVGRECAGCGRAEPPEGNTQGERGSRGASGTICVRSSTERQKGASLVVYDARGGVAVTGCGGGQPKEGERQGEWRVGLVRRARIQARFGRCASLCKEE